VVCESQLRLAAAQCGKPMAFRRSSLTLSEAEPQKRKL
jgi:hypothetical protein